MKREGEGERVQRMIARLLIGVIALGLCGAAGAVKPAMTVDRPGAVKPEGWLRDRALAAKNGFTGRMEEVDEHFRLSWTTNCMRRGKLLNWWSKHQGSWSAEGGAYWFDGLVKLAFQLDDPGLKALAKRRLDTLLDSTGTNTIAFLWWYDRTRAEDVEDAFTNGDWRFWTAGMSERALAGWWEATGDARVPKVLENVFGYGEMARRKGGSPTLLSGMADAWRITRSPAVAECLDICCAKIAEGPFATPPWDGMADTLNLKRRHLRHIKDKDQPPRHGVITSEALLSLLRAYLRTGDERLLSSVLAWYRFFDAHCRQPYGVTMMDEEWGWAGAKRGTETCDVAAETFTRENLLAALGEGRWGDDVERAFFNAGPACVSRDFMRHVYFQMPNRVGVTNESAAMSCPWDSHLKYGLSVWPLCCTAALNRILPNYVQHAWLKTAEGGVAATLYGPLTFTTEVAGGRVTFVEKTAYPFDETIEISVTEAPGSTFPLKLRMPAWCTNAEIAVNGAACAPSVERGFVTLSRAWKRGDRVNLRFPMAPRIEEFRDMNDFGRLRRSVALGPLLFAYAVPAKDDNTPLGTPVEPVLPAVQTPADFTISRAAMPSVWDWPEQSPLRLETVDADGRRLSLVPYGCTKLRISAFAVDGEGDLKPKQGE